MTDRKISSMIAPSGGYQDDDIIPLVRSGGNYSIKLSDIRTLSGEIFLHKNSIAELRNLSAAELDKLEDGTLTGVLVHGYYVFGDTPGPIVYRLSSTLDADNGFDIIATGVKKLETVFVDKDIAIEYAGGGVGVSDNVQAFYRLHAYLDATFNKGCIYFSNTGEYNFSTKIKVSNPRLSVRGAGMGVFLKFVDEGLELSSDPYFGFARIENLCIYTQNKVNGKAGLILNNSNGYFIDSVQIIGFGVGIFGSVAVLNTITRFVIQDCGIGVFFQAGSYATVLRNGIINSCDTFGVQESGSRIELNEVDIELIGGGNGTAIDVNGVVLCTKMHIEQVQNACLLHGSGWLSIKDSFIGGSTNGIRRIGAQPFYGQITIDNVSFADSTGADIDIPDSRIYDIRNIYSYVNGVQRAPIVNNLAANSGVYHEKRDVGNGVWINDLKGSFRLNGRDFATYKYRGKLSINIGPVPPGSTKTIDISVGIELNPFGDMAAVNTNFWDLPDGIIMSANVYSAGTGVRITVANLTTSAIDLGTKDVTICVI